MNWETVNPLWWVPRGYAALRVDTRGSGKSPGRTDPFSPAEARDFYDVIEWAARQPWCNGRVGLSGISYFAMTQWLVASLKPPSLAAMIPWEGAADMYRDFGYHGGIFSFGFVVNWYNNHMAHHLLGRPQASAPDSFATPWVCGVHAPQPRQRLVSRAPAGLGEHRLPALQRGQLERDGPAPAREHRGLHARGVEAQEAAHPRRHALPRASTRRKAGTTSCGSSITG